MDVFNASESSNGNRTSRLEDLLGPRRQDLVTVIPVTVIYVIIFVTGVIGNVSTCVVIARNRYMHTATNMCLFNLAISDLLVILLGLPQETYSFWSAYPWVLGSTFCVFRTMAAETSTYSSILTITAFTVERYVAICHPVRARVTSSLIRAWKVIALIWVISGTCSIPIVVQYQVVYVLDEYGHPMQDSATCNIPNDRYLSQAFEVSTFLFFVAPMTIISVLYGLIGLAIRRSALTRTGSEVFNRSGKPSDQRLNQQARARLSVIKMLVAVVVAFFLCWAPFHFQRLLIVYTDRTQSSLFNAILFYVSGILYYVSAVINPILYSIMSLKFRRAFKHSICRSNCLLQRGRHKRGVVYRRTPRVGGAGYRFHGRQQQPLPGNAAGVDGAMEGGKRDSGDGGGCVPQMRCPPQMEQESMRVGTRGVNRGFGEEGVFWEFGGGNRIVERHSGTASLFAGRQENDQTGRKRKWKERTRNKTLDSRDRDRITV